MMTAPNRPETPVRMVLMSLCLLAANWVLAGCQTTPVPHATQTATTTPMEDGAAQRTSDNVEPPVQFKTVADANAEIARLGPNPTPEQFAALVSELDSWPVEPAQQEAFQQLTLKLLAVLRGLVKEAVEQRQNAALQAPRSADGMEALEDAARILALYPVSNEPGVINEATQLSRRQADTATRLDVLRRQRYNRWATGQIERAINYYNDNVSRWNPFNNNVGLIEPLASILGPIDPVHLEPAVLELYNYIVNKASSKLSESNRLALAKELTAPSNKRRIPGEF